MRESLTGHSLFNDNKMTRGLDPRPVVLVESDADQSVLGHHLRDESVRNAPGHSKTATLLAAALHREAGDEWMIALVDRDFDASETQPSNVVTTAYYDLEAEVFFSQFARVERFAYNHLVSESLGHGEARKAAELLTEKAVELAAVLGAMRRESHLAGLGVSFSSFPVGEVLKRVSSSITAAEAASRLACQRAGTTEPELALLSAGSRAQNAPREYHHVCNGHDALNSLRTLITSTTGLRSNQRDFERGFHALIDCSVVRALSVYRPLQDWLKRLTASEMWDCAA